MDNQEFDLQKDWQKLAQEKFSSQNIKTIDIMNAITTDSKSAISKLKTSLKGKLAWIIFFVISFTIWMLFSLDRPELLMIIGLLNFFYILGFITLYFQYKKMDSSLDFSENTLAIMKQNLSLIKNALKYEKLWGMLVMPLAVIIGTLISRHYNGYTIAETFGDTSLLIRMLVITIVVLPLMYLLTEKMNDFAFGKMITKLRDNIVRLEMFS